MLGRLRVIQVSSIIWHVAFAVLVVRGCEMVIRFSILGNMMHIMLSVLGS